MNPLDFSVEELDKLFALADDIEKVAAVRGNGGKSSFDYGLRKGCDTA